MKTLRFAALFCLSLPALAAADKPNPADFPLTVHVISSAAIPIGGGQNFTYVQVLRATVNGESLELQYGSLGVLALGDYPARISTAIHAPSKHPNTYDIYRGYDLLMPDGAVRSYMVTQIGPASATP